MGSFIYISGGSMNEIKGRMKNEKEKQTIYADADSC